MRYRKSNRMFRNFPFQESGQSSFGTVSMLLDQIIHLFCLFSVALKGRMFGSDQQRFTSDKADRMRIEEFVINSRTRRRRLEQRTQVFFRPKGRLLQKLGGVASLRGCDLMHREGRC